MPKKRGADPFFTITDFKSNPVQSIFDLIEWRFYDLAPGLAGIRGGAELKNSGVYLTYELSDVQRAAYKKFVVDSSDWVKFVSRSYSLQNVIYSMIFLEGFEDDPGAVFSVLFNYYGFQQFLRIFLAPEVASWLSRIGLDPRLVGVDEPPAMDSDQPRHRGITAFGYPAALRDDYRASIHSRDLLQHISSLGTDYLAKVLDHVRILSWSQYFAQTEDAYVYGLIKEYLRRYGYNKGFSFFKEVMGGVKLEL